MLLFVVGSCWFLGCVVGFCRWLIASSVVVGSSCCCRFLMVFWLGRV